MRSLLERTIAFAGTLTERKTVAIKGAIEEALNDALKHPEHYRYEIIAKRGTLSIKLLPAVKS